VTSVAIVPAAGRSERFGSPKLVAGLQGEPLLARTLRSLLDGHVARVVVVASSAGAFERVPLIHDPRVCVVVNPQPERGMFSSVQVGLAVADGDPILILPGDMPFVREATVVAVLDAYGRSPGLIVPQHHARHGHPIALPGSIRQAALAASPSASLSDVIKSLHLETIEIEVPDKGILRDVDTPADLMG
jgi:molybdenum cofactor cytidylyltransferase